MSEDAFTPVCTLPSHFVLYTFYFLLILVREEIFAGEKRDVLRDEYAGVSHGI